MLDYFRFCQIWLRNDHGQTERLLSRKTVELIWSGFFHTTFFIDPQEELIGISMAQLHPSGDLDWNCRFQTLVYQAIDD